MSSRRIAIVNFTRMGDLIQSGPFLRSLKKAQPECHLTLIVFDKFREAAERLPMADTVLGFDVDTFAAQLDSRRADIPAAYGQLDAFLRQPAMQGFDEIYNLAHTPLSAT